jgi:nucleoside-diphosphate-sugar epimerase
VSTLLVIGGTGFFGKSILDCYKRKLLSPWGIDKVIVMSRNSDNFKKNHPELIFKGVEFFTGDIATIDHLPKADYVIHAAASTDASRYLSHNEEEKRNIIRGTLNYCQLSAKFHKDSKIVFCSSGAVYGYQPEYVKYLTEDMAFGDIESLDEVKKSYAYAKRDAESAIQKLGQVGLNVSIARCFSFIGKYLPRDQHFAIGNFIADGLAGRDINIKADRKVYRSYMYADDLVVWLMSIANASNKECPVYNVGSDVVIEIHELAKLIADIFNVDVIQDKFKPLLVDKYIPSIKKAIKVLNVSNNHSFKDAILLNL